MTELSWTPGDVARLTLPQLLCLTHEKPPGGPRSIPTREEFEARRRRREAEWKGMPADEL